MTVRSALQPARCLHPAAHARRTRLAFISTLATTPAPNLPQSLSLNALTPSERLLEVLLATSSSMLNGAVFGAIFGFFSGLWTNRGAFRPALSEAGANLRSWGAISAVYAALQTASKVIRNRDDRFNSVIGACGSGATFYLRSGPRAAAQGCVTFAALSYVIDALVVPKDDPDSDEAILRKR
ncbi:Mitochondrial import inner membrane translocase subunit TIM22-2 [Gracilariopsis chorda]|uniref:Mitochondrial import inner membrane translocase subunit TIM22 n=1 Tax=Gracilariopsis chorda TaxID=448386 RepID=A0A2V3IKP9_9FLOR|nr:Mitochondrial import inner membrane translocase subunit TIM22-2 [Gracilariopsis chorda]|eukprot:PXF42652.1 Mitochondrial import inner membrane translocase subunit TIM22-2 [Gracilariopsis chorda]